MHTKLAIYCGQSPFKATSLPYNYWKFNFKPQIKIKNQKSKFLMWEVKLINKIFTLNKEGILMHNFQNCNETIKSSPQAMPKTQNLGES